MTRQSPRRICPVCGSAATEALAFSVKRRCLRCEYVGPSARFSTAQPIDPDWDGRRHTGGRVEAAPTLDL